MFIPLLSFGQALLSANFTHHHHPSFPFSRFLTLTLRSYMTSKIPLVRLLNLRRLKNRSQVIPMWFAATQLQFIQFIPSILIYWAKSQNHYPRMANVTHAPSQTQPSSIILGLHELCQNLVLLLVSLLLKSIKDLLAVNSVNWLIFGQLLFFFAIMYREKHICLFFLHEFSALPQFNL